MGSEGFEGLGYDRRGSRHGIGGAGHDVEVYGGRVFGNRTRSSGLAREGRRGMTVEEALRASAGRAAGSPAPGAAARDGGSAPSPARPAGAGASFSPGDRVSHKKFGAGTVVEVKGDQIVVRLDSGATKTLLKGYAPIVKIAR